MLFVIPTDSIPIKGLLYGKPFLLVEKRNKTIYEQSLSKAPFGKGSPHGGMSAKQTKGEPLPATERMELDSILF